MKRYTNNVILVFGDTHFPYHHPDMFKFLEKIKQGWDIDRVVHMGDISDSYCFSNYAKAIEADNAPTEIKKMRSAVIQLKTLFPEMEIMDSNHDSRMYRKAKVAGIPREMVLPYSTFLGVDDVAWRWHEDLTLTVDSTRDQIYFAHTRTGTTLALSKSMGINAVTGHTHNSFGVQYYRGPQGVRWALDAGCLVSDKGHAFSYTASHVYRPMRGCAIIENGYPVIIPFITKGGSDKWCGTLV